MMKNGLQNEDQSFEIDTNLHYFLKKEEKSIFRNKSYKKQVITLITESAFSSL